MTSSRFGRADAAVNIITGRRAYTCCGTVTLDKHNRPARDLDHQIPSYISLTTMPDWKSRFAVLGVAASAVLAAKALRQLWLFAELGLLDPPVRKFKGEWALITGGRLVQLRSSNALHLLQLSSSSAPCWCCYCCCCFVSDPVPITAYTNTASRAASCVVRVEITCIILHLCAALHHGQATFGRLAYAIGTDDVVATAWSIVLVQLCMALVLKKRLEPSLSLSNHCLRAQAQRVLARQWQQSWRGMASTSCWCHDLRPSWRQQQQRYAAATVACRWVPAGAQTVPVLWLPTSSCRWHDASNTAAVVLFALPRNWQHISCSVASQRCHSRRGTSLGGKSH
jgi:hypothetical protein